MATKKLPDVPFAGALSNADLVHINQSSLDKKDTLDSLTEFVLKNSDRGFHVESVVASLDLTAVSITAQFKQYLFDTTAGTLNFTLPFGGGGAPSGACIMVVNDSGANNVVVEYQSGVTITLPPEGYCFIYFEGTHWELTDNNVFKVLNSFLQLGGTAGAKLTGDATKVNVRNAADSAFLDLVAKVLIGTDLTIDTDLVKTDSANNRVGVNKAVPAKTLDVVGNGEFTTDLTVGGLLSALSAAEITNFIKMLSGGNEISVQRVDSSGNKEFGTNVQWNGTNYILGREGSAGAQVATLFSLRSNGAIWLQSFSGTAGDTISDWNGNGNGYISINPQLTISQGFNRTSSGAVTHNFYADGAAGTTISAQINRASGPTGNFDIANRGSGQLRFLGIDLATVAAFFDSSLNLNLNQNLNLVVGKHIANLWAYDDTDSTADIAKTGLASGTYLVFVQADGIDSAGSIAIKEGGVGGTLKGLLQNPDPTYAIAACAFALITGTEFYIDHTGTPSRRLLAWTKIA